MIHDLKPYPAYKDSGIPWLGEVPENWEVLRSRYVFHEIDKRSVTGQETHLSMSQKYGLIRSDQIETHRLMSESYVGAKICERGDLVLNRLKAHLGVFALAPEQGLISPDYTVLRQARNIIPSYFEFVYRTPACRVELRQRAKGIVEGFWRLYTDDFYQISVPVPPLIEQSAIVRYLNYIDRRIRHYIRAKRKFIKLLEEQKRAIIHQAVTRGLDTNVKLKPSGVELLGDIPEHWEVSRVKNEFRCLNSQRIPLSGTERGTMKVRQYDYYGASGVIDSVDNYLFDDELLLIAEDGANLVLRNLPLAIVARGKFWVNNHAHILKPKKGNLEYLANLMETLNYQPWISGAAQPKLTQDRLMNITIAVPPVDEQKSIIDRVKVEITPLLSAISQAHRKISLLREYRSRLITDVVTGKLDVREAAANLPEETEYIIVEEDFEKETPQELE